MDERDLFIRAEEALQDVIDQIRDEQWDLPVPAWVTHRPRIALDPAHGVD